MLSYLYSLINPFIKVKKEIFGTNFLVWSYKSREMKTIKQEYYKKKLTLLNEILTII